MFPYLQWYEWLLAIVFAVDEPVLDEHLMSEEEGEVISQYSDAYYFLPSSMMRKTTQWKVYLLSVGTFFLCMHIYQ